MKRISLPITALVCSAAILSQTYAADFPEIVKESTDILSMKQMSTDPIPQLELLNAKGIAIVDITKGGLIIGGTGGYGIVLVKLNSPTLSALQPVSVSPAASTNSKPAESLPFMGNTPSPAVLDPIPATTTIAPATQVSSVWAAPIPVSFSGGSFGAQIGGSNTKAIVLLNSDQALNAFTHSGQLKWGANASGTSGPDSASVGRTGSLSEQDVKIYKQSDGVYGGATVGGAALKLNDKFIHEAYGSGTAVSDIIAGKVPVPDYAQPLIQLLQGLP